MGALQIQQKLASRLIAFLWVLFKSLLYHHAQLGRNLAAQRRRLAMDDSLQKLQIRRAFKRPTPAEQFIKDGAKGEDIATVVEAFTGALLR